MLSIASVNNFQSSNESIKDQQQDIYDVIAAWLPHRFDELSLSAGEKVVVYFFHEDGWCEGKLIGTDEEGIFPAACLKFNEQTALPEQSEVIKPSASAEIETD